MNHSAIYSVLLALLFAVAAGLVGSFALMKRMALAGDVMTPCLEVAQPCSSAPY